MLNLDYRDARPIYEQVKDGLRRLMVTGVIQEGEKLPSVRTMASSLAINPNTIQRAYGELETEGFVYSVTGRGTFVAEGDTQSAVRRREVADKVKPMLEELKNLGMSREELLAMWEGGNNDA